MLVLTVRKKIAGVQVTRINVLSLGAAKNYAKLGPGWARVFAVKPVVVKSRTYRY